MNRKKKLFFNTTTSLLYQILTIICGFIIPRFILTHYGSAVNGLVNSITMFLGFISFLDCGVGAVVQSTLYKPLADKDEDQVSRIVISAEKFYRKIALILVIYSTILIVLYPLSVKEEFDYVFSAALVFIISISTFMQYYFCITYRLLLNADQMGFVQFIINSLTLILNTVISIILMNCGASIHSMKLFAALIFLLQVVTLNWFVKKYYNINKKLKLHEEPIKQKWNGFAQHIASVVLSNTDTVVLTLFSTLSNVSIYGVYHMVVNGVKQIIISLTSGIQSMFGNMLAKDELDALNRTFSTLEWMMHTLVTLCFTITGALILPFVSIYTKGIEDVNYYTPVFAVLITIAQGLYCLRLPYHTVVLAAGHYKETQLSSFIEAAINIIISVVVVFKFGLIGVAIGTLLAMLYRTLYLVWYLSRNIINRKISIFIKRIIVDIIALVLMLFALHFMNLSADNYIEWVFTALKVFGICGFIELTINLFFSREDLFSAFSFLRKKIRR